MANTKGEQHARPRQPGRRDGARSRRQSRLFASDDAVATRRRNADRRRRRQLEQARAERDAKFAERLAEVPQSTLDAYAHYELEMAKRRGRDLPLLRPIEEHRRRAGVPD